MVSQSRLTSGLTARGRTGKRLRHGVSTRPGDVLSSGAVRERELAMRSAFFASVAVLAASFAPAHALDKVTFGTNWLADPEAGGYYQALVDGTYEKYGLDVKILPGGPMSNG